MRQPNIADIKKAVRERDGMCCTVCGMTDEESQAEFGRTLDVHRTVPGSLYSLEGCVTLCKECHYPQPKRTPGTPDRANMRRLVGLPERVCLALDPIAEYHCTTLTEVVKNACLEYLVAKGLWPPKEPQSDCSTTPKSGK